MSDIAWKDAWTGGQYSLLRVLVGSTVTLALLLASWSDVSFQAFPASLAIGALAITLGLGGWPVALGLAFLVAAVDLPILSWKTVQLATLWLGLHVALPAAPYGSLSARGREDPDGGWAMRWWYPAVWQVLFVCTRLATAAAWMADGNNVLAGVFVFLSVLGMMRGAALAAWALSFGLELVLAASGYEHFGAVFLFHLLVFQPAWMPRHIVATPATLFYDGSCALCHTCVRFLMAEDREPPLFRVAPLNGPTFEERVPERIRVHRPDSIVVVRGDEVLMRAGAVIAILEPLGGLWSLAAGALQLLPRPLADALYNIVASRRYQWFGRKTEACPLLPPEIRRRFDP